MMSIRLKRCNLILNAPLKLKQKALLALAPPKASRPPQNARTQVSRSPISPLSPLLCLHPARAPGITWRRFYSTEKREEVGKEGEEKREEGVEKGAEKGEEKKKVRSLLAKYLALSKARLSFLIVYTTVNGFLMAPVPIHIPTFLLTCVGTTLTVASANSINQYIEVDHDILMRRTANRPLPTGELSLNHALFFGIGTGVAGTTMLALGVNELAAGLALGNILLYTLVYTPLKRVHWLNTWVGAIVGAIPPLIGWAGATGDLSLGAFVLGYTLLIWQIPHFLALSWSLRTDYERAGYKMLVSSDADKARRLSYRYCFYFLPIPFLAIASDLTTMPFAIEALLLNFWLIYQGRQFYKEKTGTTARRLFLTTLTYLFILLICFVIHKKAGYSIEDSENVEII